jgi:glycosidase
MCRLAILLICVVTLAPFIPTGSTDAQEVGAWLKSSTMYSVFVRSFRDSDGDGVGDLQGVIDGLDYIQSLGVDTIWLLPIFKSNSYHGYDTVDYYTVQPEYGTNDDLLQLIKEVHERDMYILLDYVINHTSTEHAYFKDALGNLNSQYAEYFEWTNDAHTEFRSFASLGSMPTWNFDSPTVRQMALDIALYWLDPNKDGDFSDGIDGWRCDVALEVPHAYWKELRKQMNALNPSDILLGELYTKDAQEMRRYLLGDELNAAFDFPSALTLSGSFEANNDGLLSGNGDVGILGTLMRAQKNLYCPECVIVRFINNHDTNRVASDVNNDNKRMRMAAVWLMTAPGVPIIYYGEEIGMQGNKGTGPIYDEFRREPFDWYAAEEGTGMTSWFKPADRFNQPNDGISVEEKDTQLDSLLTLYRQLGELRGLDAFALGESDIPKLPMPLSMSRHWNDQELYVAVINFTTATQSFAFDPALLVPEGQSFNLTSAEVVLSQDLTENGDNRDLAAAGYVVYRFKK